MVESLHKFQATSMWKASDTNEWRNFGETKKKKIDLKILCLESLFMTTLEYTKWKSCLAMHCLTHHHRTHSTAFIFKIVHTRWYILIIICTQICEHIDSSITLSTNFTHSYFIAYKLSAQMSLRAYQNEKKKKTKKKTMNDAKCLLPSVWLMNNKKTWYMVF